MTKNIDYIHSANSEKNRTVIGPVTGREYHFLEHTFGVLVPDDHHPLSCVSVSNSSLSIDLWTGCAFRCAYCHVQGDDIKECGRQLTMPQRRNGFGIELILNELEKHPFFVKDQSIISIGTASTEPFYKGQVAESTISIMKAFVNRGYKNPFWVVTKAGVPDLALDGIGEVIKSGNKVMLSFCWGGNPKEIEPMNNRKARFKNIQNAKELGATTAWYMRPLAQEWYGNLNHLDEMIKFVATNYGSSLDMVVPGGLRWTEGVEYGLVEVYKQPVPVLEKQGRAKSLSDDVWDHIVERCQKHMPGKPIYKKSSCSLTAMLGVTNINSVQVENKVACSASVCSESQREICRRKSLYDLELSEAQKVIAGTFQDIQLTSLDKANGIITSPPLESYTYAIRQTVGKGFPEYINKLG